MVNLSFPSLPDSASSLPSRQKGAVLLIGMALLIIITMFALAAIRGITLQERISGGLYDRELAFSAAEAALRWAERQYMINAISSTPTSQAFMATVRDANNDPVCPVGGCPAGNPPNTEAYFASETTYAAMAAKPEFIRLDGTTNALLVLPIFQSGAAATNSAQSAAGAPLYMAAYLQNGGGCGTAVRINTVGVGRNPNTLVVLESIVCQ